MCQRNGFDLIFASFCNKVVAFALKVVAGWFEVVATSQKLFRSCRFFSQVEFLYVEIRFWKCIFNLERDLDNKKVKRLAAPLHSLNRHNGLCIDRPRPVHLPCGKQVYSYRQCVGSNILTSFPSMALACQSLQMDFCKCPSTRHLSFSAFFCPVPVMTGILQTPVPWM